VKGVYSQSVDKVLMQDPVRSSNVKRPDSLKDVNPGTAMLRKEEIDEIDKETTIRSKQVCK
jgi:hypothetical protein